MLVINTAKTWLQKNCPVIFQVDLCNPSHCSKMAKLGKSRYNPSTFNKQNASYAVTVNNGYFVKISTKDNRKEWARKYAEVADVNSEKDEWEIIVL